MLTIFIEAINICACTIFYTKWLTIELDHLSIYSSTQLRCLSCTIHN